MTAPTNTIMTTDTAVTTMPDGLVDLAQYDRLVKSPEFAQVEKFSNFFIASVGDMVRSYNIRWVADPLHQWSRQWEYLYILNRLRGLDRTARIVDVGAGLSFLPYFLKRELGLQNVLAVDYDQSLAGLYDKVNKKMGVTVPFQFGDMRELNNIQDESVDFIYSVSALEHTDSYDDVLKELYRILKPGGTLSFTFDISLDGLDDIPLERAKLLIATLEKVFNTTTSLQLEKDIKKTNLVTTQAIAKKDKALLPWKYPSLNVIKHLLHHGKPGHAYKQLTFACVTVQKK